MVLVLILGGFRRFCSDTKMVLVGPMWSWLVLVGSGLAVSSFKVGLGVSVPDCRWFSEVLGRVQACMSLQYFFLLSFLLHPSAVAPVPLLSHFTVKSIVAPQIKGLPSPALAND